MKTRNLLITALAMILTCASCQKDENVINVSGITVSPTNLELTIGDIEQLTATIMPENATDKTIIWSSDKTNIVTVDDSGKVTAIAVGNATVTAKIGDKTATCLITVSKNGITTFNKLKAALIAEGGTADNPVKITLNDNISTSATINEEIVVKGYKLLDGGGYTLTRQQVPNPEGIKYNLFTDADGQTSLTVTHLTLKNKYEDQTMFFFANKGSNLFLGPDVTITSNVSITMPLIDIRGGSKATIDGTTFRCNAANNYGTWIQYSSNRAEDNAFSSFILNNSTFENTKYDIQLNSTNNLSIPPGITLALYFNIDESGKVSISPTEGSFTQTDIEKLSICPYSCIDGHYANGDSYEIWLDADGFIKLRKKTGITSQASLQEAIDAATGTIDNPTIITLDASFNVNSVRSYIPIVIGDKSGTVSKHIKINGNGKTLTAMEYTDMLQINGNSSLILTNITINGNNQKSNWGGLITIKKDGILTIDKGTTIKNLKNSVERDYSSHGIILEDDASLIIENETAISGIEGQAITLAPNCSVQFNGGVISGSAVDIFTNPSNSNAQIKVTKMPIIDNNINKPLKLEIKYSSSADTRSIAEGISSSNLNTENFSLVSVYDTNGNATNRVELIKDINGIIKVRPKSIDN